MTEMKLFNRWDTSKIEVKDQGLKRYINLSPIIVPRNHGRHASKQFYKSGINIVERLINHLMIPGHHGKRHITTSNLCTGKSDTIYNVVLHALEIIEKKTGMNPVEVFVRGIENAALREEITAFRLGGIVGRKAVISAPQRRIDLALRLIAQAAFTKVKGNSKKMKEVLADEIIACYKNDGQVAAAIREKDRIEREAAGAR